MPLDLIPSTLFVSVGYGIIHVFTLAPTCKPLPVLRLAVLPLLCLQHGFQWVDVRNQI